MKIVILPVGSYEYHGKLLPYETDLIIASEVAKSLSAKFSDSILLPPLPYGMAFEHSDFPTTISIKTDVYYNYLMNLLNSLNIPNSLILLVNAHGGNHYMMNIIQSDYNYTHDSSKVYYKSIYSDGVVNLAKNSLGEFDSHAGSVENSLLAFYNNLERIIVKDERFVKPMPGALHFFRNMTIGETGVVKDTDTLIRDPEIGAKMHETIVNDLERDVRKTMELLKSFSGIKTNE